eukprot:TRINITY_DN1771_c0_g1_i1.p2 TRINITY_DN1771_c0_g1~~TRINITY_DN1771_c0_g1_i1.p2  ORF type:complete len:177 (-),score=28.40 TRINITY_DN1771_c0_g1_i1:225-755(-)
MKCVLFLVVLAVALARPLNVKTFSVTNCDSDPFVINSLKISPDPIVLGGNITVTGDANLPVTISNAQLALTLEKKEGFWIEIPCVDGVGSCTYADFCTLFKNTDKPCPEPFPSLGVPCHCPFPAKHYVVPPTTIETKNPNLSWLTDGEFYAKAVLTDNNSGNEIGCFEIYLDLSSN